jgi:hypothetical protein
LRFQRAGSIPACRSGQRKDPPIAHGAGVIPGGEVG